MPRPSLVLISTGGAALLVVLVLLWRSTQSEAQAVQPTSSHATVTPAAPPPPAGAGPAARTGKTTSTGSPTKSPVTTRGTAGPAPSLTAAPVATESDDPSTNRDNLHFGGTQLRAQHAAVEPLVRACVDKVVAAGGKPSGTAVLTYVVAKHDDAYEIEDTSYDADETTLGDAGLVECLHQTAKAMKFVGLPRRAKGLVVTRRVTIEAGALTEYKHVGFSYLR